MTHAEIEMSAKKMKQHRDCGRLAQCHGGRKILCFPTYAHVLFAYRNELAIFITKYFQKIQFF